MIYVESGELLGSAGSHPFRVRAGDLLLHGNARSAWRVSGASPDFRGAALDFSSELVHRSCTRGSDLDYLLPFLGEGFPNLLEADTAIPQQIVPLMGRISDLIPAEDKLAHLTIETYLKMILIILVNHSASQEGATLVSPGRIGDAERLSPLFAYIEQSYSEPITVADAAKKVHMSKSNFTRFFRQNTAKSFIAYLNELRVARAQLLLATTSKSIAEISQETGFCDQSYFGLTFRRTVGQTPREYRDSLGLSTRSRHVPGISESFSAGPFVPGPAIL